MTRLRKYMFLFPLKCLSSGKPAAETMPFTHVRMEYWPILAAKEIAE